MKKKPFSRLPLIVLLLAGVIFAVRLAYNPAMQGESADNIEDSADAGTVDGIFNVIRGLLSMEPGEVKELREREVPQADEGHREYYFQLLSEDEKRGYREMLAGIRAREERFYLTIAEDAMVDRVYHALLKDHPELFWIHNRESVYKTTYGNADYSSFSPGYTYTDEEVEQISQSMEAAYQEVLALLPQGADTYEKVKTVYTYLIDSAEYNTSEHDQSIAGIFWKKEAVCAGYAGALQYLLERLSIPCIYVEGDASDSTEGHAWNIVEIDGENYYVDVTNGDQPEFLEGDAVQLAEHKTTIYDYLCPFPWEYEVNYTPSPEFPVPECTATAKNFYVLNGACFDTYDWNEVLDLCRMRIDNGAAVVRFKFADQESFDLAYQDWIMGDSIQQVAHHYMRLYGMREIEYHYGVLENLKTIYYMF